MNGLPFLKMHGAGNDFVVLDGRARPVAVAAAEAKWIADRRLGVGCDQIIIIEVDAAGGDAFMRILNADGSESGACGNATRCVAALLAQETGQRRVSIRTISGLLPSEIIGPGLVEVDMGEPGLEWDQIPLSAPADTLSLKIAMGPVEDPAACSMGNPHATFFVQGSRASADRVDRPAARAQQAFPAARQYRLRLHRGAGPHPPAGLGTRLRPDAWPAAPAPAPLW